MPLRFYICKKCKNQPLLFDEEFDDFVAKSQCVENTCELELKPVDNAHTAGTTEMYSNRHVVYDTMGERIKWNNADMKRKEQEDAAKKFQEGLKKL